MVERKDPSRIVGFENEADARRYVEDDYKIRSGLCPNGHGLLVDTNFGQQCETCGFITNLRAEARRDG